jgi:hypothetical protein
METMFDTSILMLVIPIRVTPLEFIEQAKEQDYDKEKYRDMLLDAAETLLGMIFPVYTSRAAACNLTERHPGVTNQRLY